MEVRPHREIGVARRWKAPRVQRSARAFASAGWQRPSGRSPSLSGDGRHAGRPRPSSSVGESRRKRALGALLRKGKPSTERKAVWACSEYQPLRGSDKRCPGLIQVGVNPSRCCRASRRGSPGTSFLTTPELGRFGWCPPQGVHHPSCRGFARGTPGGVVGLLVVSLVPYNCRS